MTSPGWSEIERIYLEASGLAPAGRASFLDQACTGQSWRGKQIHPVVESCGGRQQRRRYFTARVPIACQSVAFKSGTLSTEGQRKNNFTSGAI